MSDNSFAFQIIRRLFICLVICIVLLFASNLAWLLVFSQYDFEAVEVEQYTDDMGDCNYIGSEGDITYGETENQENFDEEEQWQFQGN